MTREQKQEQQHQAEMWALADDDNMRHLLTWQRVKKRAEAGGFNGLLASDFRFADVALHILTEDMPVCDASKLREVKDA